MLLLTNNYPDALDRVHKEILSSSPLREEEDAQQTLAAKKEKEEAER